MIPGSARNWIAVNAVQQSILNEKLNKNMTTLHLRKSISWSPLRLGLPRNASQPMWIIRGFLLIPLARSRLALRFRRQLERFVVKAAASATPTPSLVMTRSSANTTGSYNTATGFEALSSNTTGDANTANGAERSNNTTGSYNTANGFSARSNTTGNNNTANGANGAL